MWIRTAQQCREIDLRTIQEFMIPSKELMKNAGLAVFKVVKDKISPPAKIAVVCGKGNNGGDGFVVAQVAKRAGYRVECFVTSPKSGLGEQCLREMQKAIDLNIEVTFSNESNFYGKLESLCNFELIVDAILGIGAKGNVRNEIEKAIDSINKSRVPVISIDVPSGIDTDTGQKLNKAVLARHTVTFGFPKPFLFQGDGMHHAGIWSIAEIGYPNELEKAQSNAQLLSYQTITSHFPVRDKNAHKGSSGHLLIVAGSHHMRGAAVLAAKAAYRSGIGLVTVASIDSVCDSVMNLIPEAILLPLPENQGAIASESSKLILENQARYDAAIFGPGLTSDKNIAELLTTIWKDWKTPSVLDADALNVISAGVKPPNCPSVMTPHPGELGRLIQKSIDEIQSQRLQSIQESTKKFQTSILLKGQYSIVSSPDKPLEVNITGNPGMATAGMGDVLSGMIGTLLAQNLEPHWAASCGMFWHGIAGDFAAKSIGDIGYTASDLINFIPKARTKLTL